MKELEFMEEMSSPRFTIPLKCPVIHYRTREQCELRSLDRTFRAKEQDLEVLACICNEPHIYDVLFRQRCNGRPYSIADAERFFLWARDGWARGEWFVFLIRDSNRRILGTIDIKSSQLAQSEIGYYASNQNPGIMTNTVMQLCEVARTSGYKRLYALISPDNRSSVAVAVRAGFTKDGEQARNGKKYLKFSRMLS